jgi:hypothetical protein
LQLRLELETLISNLSRRFLSSETAEIDDVIREGLRSVAQVAASRQPPPATAWRRKGPRQP